MSGRAGRQAFWFGAGMAGGLLAGMMWWSREQHAHKQALYHRRPMRRLAALGWIGREARPTVESVLMLRDYLSWERNPVLLRRARRLLARFENAIV